MVQCCYDNCLSPCGSLSCKMVDVLKCCCYNTCCCPCTLFTCIGNFPKYWNYYSKNVANVKVCDEQIKIIDKWLDDPNDVKEIPGHVYYQIEHLTNQDCFIREDDRPKLYRQNMLYYNLTTGETFELMNATTVPSNYESLERIFCIEKGEQRVAESNLCYMIRLKQYFVEIKIKMATANENILFFTQLVFSAFSLIISIISIVLTVMKK